LLFADPVNIRAPKSSLCRQRLHKWEALALTRMSLHPELCEDRSAAAWKRRRAPPHSQSCSSQPATETAASAPRSLQETLFDLGDLSTEGIESRRVVCHVDRQLRQHLT